MTSIANNISNIKKNINNDSVRLIAVSKTKPISDILEAIKAGQQNFAENYLQEALDKISVLKKHNLIWHFIGTIQSNKTSKIAENFNWVHTVDRFKIAKRLNEQRPKELDKLNICIQVNIDNEETKSGVKVEELEDLIINIRNLDNISLQGLMCIPKNENAKQSFKKMSELKNKYQLNELSMGMSNDITEAVKYGSTMIRVGRGIFGKRN